MFPPKTDIGSSNLIDRIERMTALAPAWIHVTWGAGGSTHETSLDLAGAAQALGIDTCLHLTCTNMLKDVLDGALEVSSQRQRQADRLRERSERPSRRPADGVADPQPFSRAESKGTRSCQLAGSARR